MKFWGWFLQRITGAIILLLVIIHVSLAYFAGHGGDITFATVQHRVAAGIFWVDLLLLYTGLLHGLYGLHVVVCDLVPAWKGRNLLIVFVAAGLCFACLGTGTLARLT